MTDEHGLPEEIIRDDAIRIAVGVDKFCRCLRRNFVVDPANRQVTCAECGAPVDPFEACKEIAYRHDEIASRTKLMLEQRQALVDWKPWLVALREMERELRRGLSPCCPSCRQPFDPKDVTTWVGRRNPS